MKNVTLLVGLGLLMTAGLSVAQPQSQAAPQAAAAAVAPPAAGTSPNARAIHALEAEIVSVDTAGNTITFKAEGAQRTAPVGVNGRYRLKDLKAGDKVRLSCKDVDGKHTEIVSIRPSRTDKTGKPIEAQ